MTASLPKSLAFLIVFAFVNLLFAEKVSAQFSLSLNQSTFCAGETKSVIFTATAGVKNMGGFAIQLPTGFTAASPTGVIASNGKAWTASLQPGGNTICLTATASNGRLPSGGTVSVTVNVAANPTGNPPYSITGFSTTSLSCPTSGGALTVSPQFTVSSLVTPTVTISSSDADNTICAGTPVTFTATPLNGGAAPSYQWKLNGFNTGTNNSTFTTSSLNNGDNVSVILTSNAACVTTPTATSGTITTSVNTRPKANLTSTNTIICSGTPTTLTGTVTASGAWTLTLNDGSSVSGSGNLFEKEVTPTNTSTYTISSLTDANCSAITNDLTGSTQVIVHTNLATPGTITGPVSVCSNATGLTYSVPTEPGTTYTWALPTDWVINSENGTSSISVTAGIAGQNGDITVTATNTCGTSGASNLPVTVNNRPTANITGGTTATPVCSGSSNPITGTVNATGAWTLTLSNGGGSATGNGNGTFTINVSPTSTTTYTIASLLDASCSATTSDLSGSALITTKEVVVTPVINTPICSGATSISGTGENGSSIIVFVNNNPLPPVTVSNGTWTISGISALAAGDVINAEASITGKCNAVSSSVTVLAFLAAPVITYPIYAGSTSVSGTHGTNGATITVYINGTPVPTTATVSSGQWTLTVPTLTVNSKVTARASIAGGCTSSLSNEVTVITAVTGFSGDYRSVAINGSWNDLSSWQINNSGTWAIPTSTQGYPGEKMASGTIYIQSGSTIYTATNLSNVGAVVINGKLEVNNTLTINSSRNVTVNGTIQFDNDGIINAGGNSINFSMSDNSRLITANPAGINSSGTSGSVQVTGTRTFLNTAHYTYNGITDQVTGTGLPSLILEQGSFTVNNTGSNAKVNLSNSLTVYGPLNLTSGALSIPSGLTLNLYGTINTVAGTIAGTPTSILNIEDDGRSAAITNTNPGTPNAILFSGSPAVFQNIAYRRASVAATIGSDLTLYGNLLNSAGNALNFGTTTTTFTGSATQSMGGLSSITFQNLIIDKTAGRVNSTNHITVKGTLTLKSGNLSTGSSRLTVEGDLLGAQPGNTFGSGNMIISTEVGAELRRFITNNNSYLFPVGDLTSRYAPVELTFTGGDISSGTRYASVNVRNAKHPNNTNTTNYITRYWIIDTDIPSLVYNIKATYHDLGISSTDVVGTDSKILFARWKGIPPSPTTPKPYWERYPSSIDAGTNVFSKTGLTSVGMFTGISSNDPTVSISVNPGTTVCQNATLTLTANTTADAPLTYSWNNDLYTTTTITPSTTTPTTEAMPYTITVSDGNGFMATSETVAITINPLPALFTVSGGAVYCSNQTASAPVSLSGSETGISYQLKSGTTVVQTLAGNGSALNFTNLSEAGTYTVVAINDATGCTRTMTGSATVTINPLPTLFSVTGGGAYCSGGTGVAVGLDGSQAGVSYQLLQDDTPVGSPVTGTGNAISFGNQTQASTYTVKATNITTTCTNDMTGSATVTINPLPTLFSVTGGGAYCSGGTGVAVGLDGSQAGVSYQLMRGSTAVGAPVLGTGSSISFGLQTVQATYTVIATITATNCNATMTGSATVNINPLPPTSVTASGPITFCQGGSVILSAPEGYSYSWSNGATSQSITVSENGNYTVTVVASEVAEQPLPSVTLTV